MTGELVVLLNGEEAGRLWRAKSGELRLAYVPAWQEAEDAYPLSLSMPLARREHRGAAVEAYLEGLLPDNDAILRNWGRRFGVSARNPFALLAHVGEDCAGAVQFAAPERVDAVRSAAAGSVTWLSDAEVAQRLRELGRDPAAWREASDTGQFSLAGAQRKTALLRESGRWGVPSGRVPTTHILKPPLADFAGAAENEHLCLALADRLGLPVARSEVLRFEEQVVIAVERYDRVSIDGELVRIHQEDFCQALGWPPRQKYEAEGGPGARAVVGVLREHASRPDADVARFVDALAFNWAVGGTDAHAKNYSVLIGARRQVFLAPLYDIASALPYPKQVPLRKMKLAMKVGGEYQVWKIDRRSWARFAEEAGLDPDAVVARVRDLLDPLPDHLTDVCARARADGLGHPIVGELETAVHEHVRRCREALERGKRAGLGS